MKRRDFIKMGMTGLAAITVGSARIPYLFGAESITAVQTVDLSMEAALVEMVDQIAVFHWLFSTPGTGPCFPGPFIFATTGDDITINITNNLTEPHAFQIVGTRVLTPPIIPGQTRTVRFKAPAAGTYLYMDPLNDPVNRVLGLHGALIVMPAAGSSTPYDNPTPKVQQLFSDLGTTLHFPKNARSPAAGWQHDRVRVWLHHQIDPAFNTRAESGLTISPADMRANFLPRYFTLNGKSGVFASHDDTNLDPRINSVLTGRIGEPMLVRIMNAGLYVHSDHLHANHFYVTAVNNVVQDNVLWIDSLAIMPLDRIDWLVPYTRPPDIPGDPAIPLINLIPTELSLVIGGVPQSPLGYPMHCHMEISQTAAGGNYPQGLVTHFEFLGDVNGIDFPNVPSLAVKRPGRRLYYAFFDTPPRQRTTW